MSNQGTPVPDYAAMERLTPGHTYKIEFDDCCVKGALTAEFIGYERDKDGNPKTAIFVEGHLTLLWGAYTATDLTARKDTPERH